MLREDIEEIVKRSSKRKRKNEERDTQIVCEYFGMGEFMYPTHEVVGEKYGFVNRERTRQIIGQYFLENITVNDLESIKIIVNILNKEPGWLVREFVEKISSIVGAQINIKGLINLLNTLKYTDELVICSCDFTNISAKDLSNNNLVIIKKKKQSRLKKTMNKLYTLPGMNGLYNLEFALSSVVENKEKCFFKKVIELDDKVSIVKGWYLVEKRDNVIVNSLEKITNVCNSVKKDVLVDVLYNCITKRSLNIEHPDSVIIKEYLKNSTFIKKTEDYYKIEVEKSELNEIDQEIIFLFTNTKSHYFTYAELHEILENKGYTDAYIKKIYASPFIYTDRSRGRKKYKLYFIDKFSLKTNLDKIEEIVEDQHFLNEINNYIMVESHFEFLGQPKIKEEPCYNGEKRVFKRSRQTSKNALAHADYNCENKLCKNDLFLRKNSDIKYTEPHHLIPLAHTDEFKFSLDVEENIVSLCSSCHNLLHYGKDFEELLRALYEIRREDLEKAGIGVDIECLIEMYN